MKTSQIMLMRRSRIWATMGALLFMALAAGAVGEEQRQREIIGDGAMPPPFYRVLKVGEHPCQTGHDVLVLQNLLQRAERSSGGTILNVTNCFDTQTASALSWFQGVVGVESTGVLDVATAKEIIEKLTDDNYVDDGLPAATRGYL